MDEIAGDENLTKWLRDARRGDQEAADRAWQEVYPKLRMLAHRQLRSSGPITLETSALVHEAYFRLAGGAGELADRHHFLSLAATAMRQIVIDEVRKRCAAKRGAGQEAVTLTGVAESVADPGNAAALLDLDQALDLLGEEDPRLAKIIELRFFGGLTLEEAAEILQISIPTIVRETRIARAFLRRRLGA